MTGAKALGGRVIAVLNTASGSYDPGAEERLKAMFAEAGLAEPQVDAAAPGDIEAALAKAVKAADVLVVLGGDGTIRTAANLCAECGAVLVPLPGGTMNMLPHALYGLVKWEEALANTLAAPTLHHVSGGMIGTEAFYCAAILGAPTLWADVREALRHWRLGEAVTGALKALRRSDIEPLDFAFDQTRGSAQAVVVICPLVSRALDAGDQGLEAAAIDARAPGVAARLALHALLDDWRNDPAVETVKARTIRVTAAGRVRSVLDGEAVRLGRKVEVTFRPKAFTALAPASLPGQTPNA